MDKRHLRVATLPFHGGHVGDREQFAAATRANGCKRLIAECISVCVLRVVSAHTWGKGATTFRYVLVLRRFSIFLFRRPNQVVRVNIEHFVVRVEFFQSPSHVYFSYYRRFAVSRPKVRAFRVNVDSAVLLNGAKRVLGVHQSNGALTYSQFVRVLHS